MGCALSKLGRGIKMFTFDQTNDADLHLSISKTVYQTTQQMQDISNILFNWNWLDTTGASISVRLPEKKELFALTPRAAGFRRWKLQEEGLAVLDFDLNLTSFSTTSHLAHNSAEIHAYAYKSFDNVNAILHTHSPHSLTYACANQSIYPHTLQSQVLGEVPCFIAKGQDVPDRHINYPTPNERATSGMDGYQHAYKEFRSLFQQISEAFSGRVKELEKHGLAFTVAHHGVFILARTLDEAFDNLIRVERNAQVQLLSKSL